MKYLIDVRSPSEYREGAIPGAMHHDIYEMLAGNLPKVPKDAEIELYCLSGARAEMARQVLENNGFTNVRNAGAMKDIASK